MALLRADVGLDWTPIDTQVRKGEKSSLVVFYKEFDVGTADDTDDGKRRVARASWAFNADQVDGYAAPQAPEPLGPIDRIAAADRLHGTWRSGSS